MNKKYLSDYIKTHYGSRERYAETIGLDPKHGGNIITQIILRNNLKSLNLDVLEGMMKFDNKIDFAKLFGVEKIFDREIQGIGGIPLVPVKAHAGYLDSFEDESYIDTLQKFIVPGFDSNGNDKRIFQVSGDSMYKTLCNDDLVLSVRVEVGEPIKDRHVYVVVTQREGVVIKRVSDRTKERGLLVLHSDNSKGGYSPKLCYTEEIKELWYVKGKITYDLSRDTTMEEELSELRNEIAVIRAQFEKLLH